MFKVGDKVVLKKEWRKYYKEFCEGFRDANEIDFVGKVLNISDDIMYIEFDVPKIAYWRHRNHFMLYKKPLSNEKIEAEIDNILKHYWDKDKGRYTKYKDKLLPPLECTIGTFLDDNNIKFKISEESVDCYDSMFDIVNIFYAYMNENEEIEVGLKEVKFFW